MAGRGIIEAQDRIEHPRVLTLNRDDIWVPAVDPIHFDESVAGIGPGRTFGIEIATIYSAATIGLVPCAVGGTSIDAWQPGASYGPTNSKPWDDAIRRTKIAMQSGTLKGVLWHQGESDAHPVLAARYAEKLRALIARLRLEFGSPDLPVMLGQLGQFHEGPPSEAARLIDQALREVPPRVPHTTFVSAAGLQHVGDRIHFDAASARELGRRYAADYLAQARSR